jgi:hypothetical protein
MLLLFDRYVIIHTTNVWTDIYLSWILRAPEFIPTLMVMVILRGQIILRALLAVA